jgi:hypothetical protein
MQASAPVLQLRAPVLARRNAIASLLSRQVFPHDHRAALRGALEFKDAELDFARALCRRSNLWIWRVDQRAYGGDFLVVDVSSPRIDHRPVLALDLKRGRKVVVDRPGVQMKDAAKSIAFIARAGVVAPETPALYVTGDAWLILGDMPSLLDRARALARSRTMRT